jgi:hypothetical protein
MNISSKCECFHGVLVSISVMLVKHYSGFRSYGSIACMFVIMGAFPRLEDVQERADGAVEDGNGTCGKLAQVRLEFAVRQFDRVEVG